MFDDICMRPSIAIFLTGLAICIYAFGGRGAYAGSPELRKIELYHEIESFSTLSRDSEGVLEISLDRPQFFEGTPPVLREGASEKLSKLKELLLLEGVRSSAVYSQSDISEFDDSAEFDADQRVKTVQDYLDK